MLFLVLSSCCPRAAGMKPTSANCLLLESFTYITPETSRKLNFEDDAIDTHDEILYKNPNCAPFIPRLLQKTPLSLLFSIKRSSTVFNNRQYKIILPLVTTVLQRNELHPRATPPQDLPLSPTTSFDPVQPQNPTAIRQSPVPFHTRDLPPSAFPLPPPPPNMCDWYKNIYYGCGHTVYAFGRFCGNCYLIRQPCKNKNIWQTFRMPEVCNVCKPHVHDD